MQFEFTLDTIQEAARRLWEQVNNQQVVALYGPMGAGKTTFVQALCAEKKVSSTVGSPTFSIINEYAYPEGKLYHIDLYRLKDEEEAIRTGVEDCLFSGQICLVEWPERAPGIFPEHYVAVKISVADQKTRLLQIEQK